MRRAGILEYGGKEESVYPNGGRKYFYSLVVLGVVRNVV